MTIAQTKKQDVPLPIALFLLVITLFGLFVISPASKGFDYGLVEAIIEVYGIHISIMFVSLIINLTWSLSVFKRILGLKKQGSRLKKLTGEKGQFSKRNMRIILFSLAIGGGTFQYLHLLLSPYLDQLSILSTYKMIILGNLAFTAFILIYITSRWSLFKAIFDFSLNRLPRFPKVKNGVVLGAVNEEKLAAKKPTWIKMNKQALNGNILITGSIGSGKTQGTVLPYLDQIFTNFELCPSMLIIDPKRSFVPKVMEMINKHQKEERVLHLKLGGKITINPVYKEGILRNSGFLNSAHMFQAASINFMGKSNDSPFWGVSSFNLIKNSIIYCAAVLDYYTLEDIYKTIVRASNEGLDQELINALENKEWGEEEIFNIECALVYFQDEYNKMDNKLKSSILATSTAFLNQFQEFRANKIFCPDQDQLTISSIDSVIDEGKIMLFDIEVPALAKSMGTYLKLLFQQSLLERISDNKRGTKRSFLTVIDEYQDVVTAGNGATIGDDRYLSKSREGNAITIVATQSLVSLMNSVGREDATKELVQNFRTRIACHSADLYTIRTFQELIGKEEIERTSHSLGEFAQNAQRNFLLGGFESEAANISESVNKSSQTDYTTTGKEFSKLKTFEAFGLIYDGVSTGFKKLYLKPYFLQNKRIKHSKILKLLVSVAICLVLPSLFSNQALAFPNICSVVKTKDFESCLEFDVKADVCTWGPFTRPCARISYYVPSTFIEVFPHEGQTFFENLPGAMLQLKTLDKIKIPFGNEGNHSFSYHAHSLAVPFDSVFQTMLCGGTRVEKFCFDGMSEHLKFHWKTGYGDRLQPAFLAWQMNPKACLVKGAVFSVTGSPEWNYGNDLLCSFPFDWYSTFPPSAHSVCNGWGITFPRMGTYHGTSQVTAALMIAARMKSLSSEVFQATPGALFEKWQMIHPNTSSCFREGQNMSILETIKGVNEIGRLTKGSNGYLFVIWQRTSCKRDWPAVWVAKGFKEIIKPVCEGLGDIL